MSKAKIALIISIVAVIIGTIIAVISVVSVNNDNAEMQLKLGYKLLAEGKYEEAIIAFDKVISIDTKSIDARVGMSKAFVGLERYAEAETVLNEALKIEPKSAAVYDALLNVYKIQSKYEEINQLIKNLEGIGLESEADKYRPSIPTSNTPSGSYNSLISVALYSDNTQIYYTTDGLTPTVSSIKYEQPIELTNGNITVKAISIDGNGVCSKVATYEYIIELPGISPPKTSIAAGNYDKPQDVALKNNNNRGTIFYTVDGSTPNDRSNKYSMPIKVNNGTTTIKAVIIDTTTGTSSNVESFTYKITQVMPTATPTPQRATQTPTTAPTQNNSSPFFNVTVQSGTGYTMKKFFSDLFGFEVESSYMRGVGIPVDESAWNKEVSQPVWNTWVAWRKEKYGY